MSNGLNKLSILTLLQKYPIDEVEYAVVKIFIDSNGITGIRNAFIKNIYDIANRSIANEISEYFTKEKIPVDLKTIEKIFELLVPHEDRKTNGIYYTPDFIVEFVTKETIKGNVTVCDPACGSGAFLVGAVKRICEITKLSTVEVIEKNIYGADISHRSINHTKIILSLLSIENKDDKEKINFNLIVGDSLRTDWVKEIPAIFAQSGFDVIIGNPPYVSMNLRKDRNLKNQYKSSGVADETNLYLLFIELSLRLLKDDNAYCGLIVPLSLSYHQGKNFFEVRRQISKSSGKWMFSFYDRSPDSLFGDNIKTRNCIFIYGKHKDEKPEIFVTKLIRWNSRTRDRLFKELKYQYLGDYDISEGIPKISDPIEMDSLNRINFTEYRLDDKIAYSNIDIGQRRLDSTDVRENSIYYYSTAYNWVSAFKQIPKSYNEKNELMVPDSVSRILTNTPDETNLIYACLNSRLAYWYWLVYGDGFHISKQFISELPFNSQKFSSEAKRILSELGEKLWDECQKYPIVKVNSSKRIGNYDMLRCKDLIEKIDAVLIKELNLNSDFREFLKTRYVEHITAGRNTYKNIKCNTGSGNDDRNTP